MNYGEKIRVNLDGFGYKQVMLINTGEEEFPIGLLDLSTYTVLDSYANFSSIPKVDVVEECMKLLAQRELSELTYVKSDGHYQVEEVGFGYYDENFGSYFLIHSIKEPTPDESYRLVKLFEALQIQKYNEF